jgi:hypothetical protein
MRTAPSRRHDRERESLPDGATRAVPASPSLVKKSAEFNSNNRRYSVASPILVVARHWLRRRHR